MPHSLSSSSSAGLQALILCGPGASLNTFTSNPDDFPKALIPIANRPMIWYPLDWCLRMGVSKIHLITPKSSAKAIEAALSQNPHLTSLPQPHADLLSPNGLSQTSGTADILRFPEVQAVITGNFLVLPCDIVCEVSGESFFEAWMVEQGRQRTSFLNNMSLHNSSGYSVSDPHSTGGLAFWYPVDKEASKTEETDFLISAKQDVKFPYASKSVLGKHISTMLYSSTVDTLKDVADGGSFLIRQRLLELFGDVKARTNYRDAHVYLFPRWILDMASKNESLESISEDLVGWWAKSTWQEGLASKLQLPQTELPAPAPEDEAPEFLATGIKGIALESSIHSLGSPKGESTAPVKVPDIQVYTHPPGPNTGLVRRVDNSAALLAVSLQIAKLPSVSEAGRAAAGPLAHAHKVAHPDAVAQKTTVARGDCLLAENVQVSERCVLRETVVGRGCSIGVGVRLARCVLMDGVSVGERCQLSGCIVGRRAQVGKGCVLKDCEVQDAFSVAEGTNATGENFMVFEGLEDDGDDDMGGDGAGIGFA